MKLLPKLKERASRLKRELHALWLAYSDPRTPWLARLLVVCIIAYALRPIDLIPDPIPIIGHLDDLILLPLGIALAIRMILDSVMADCRERARHANFDRPSQADFLVRTQSIRRTQPKKSIKITQVIESKARAEHRPSGEEEKIRAFERMEILVKGGKS